MARTLAFLGMVVAMSSFTACVHPPKPLQGEFPPVSVYDAQSGDLTGQRVRWGGVIVSTKPEKDRTCLEIVSKPLDSRARPRPVDQSYGRFDACAQGFYDPQIYSRGREVTVVGIVAGSRAGQVGEYQYPFPHVDAETILLWPELPPYDYYGGYYYPYAYPTGVYVGPLWYPYYYPYWWGGYWGGWGWGGGWHGGGWHGGGWHHH